MRQVTYIYEWIDIDTGGLRSHTVDAVLVDDNTIIYLDVSENELEVNRSKHPIIVVPGGIVRHTSDMDFFIVGINLMDEGIALSIEDLVSMRFTEFAKYIRVEC